VEKAIDAIGCHSMQLLQEIIQLATNKRIELKNITREVAQAVERAKIKRGIVNIFTPHTTTAIIINEGEMGLLKDFEAVLQSLIPSGKGYLHDLIDSNADSHLRAIILGSSITIPIQNGNIALGSWQSIFFVELDGPRERTIRVSVIGD
jgi:secondary thiamine-phosphate synthase enzyme